MIQSTGYMCSLRRRTANRKIRFDLLSCARKVPASDLDRHCNHTKELQRFVPVEVAHFD